MEKFSLTDEIKGLLNVFTQKNFVANDGNLVLSMGCNPCGGGCTGSCGGSCSSTCSGSCKGTCTFSCSRYQR